MPSCAIWPSRAWASKRVRTDVSVSYLDHNLLYVNTNTPDDHIFLTSIARKYGIYLSRPGNGIMHSVQYARFGVPGKTSLGTDSHTTTGGAIGMLAIGGGQVWTVPRPCRACPSA